MSGTEAAISMATPGLNGSSATPPPLSTVPPIAEAKPEPAEAGKEQKDIDFSGRFAALTKKERELLAQKQQFTKEREAAKAELAAVEAHKQAVAQAKTNPIAYLEAAGLTMQDIADFVLNDKKLTPEQQIKLLQERLDKEDADKKAAQADAEQKAVDAQIKVYRESLGSVVKANPEKYDLLTKHGENGEEAMFETAWKYFETTGQVPDPALVADHVESYLEAEYTSIISSSQKLKPKETTVTESPDGMGQTTPQPPKPSVTLTNQALASASSPQEDWSSLSADESKKRAAAMLKWK